MQGPVVDWAQAFLDGIPMQDGQRILDVGCRDGEFTNMMSQRYPTSHFTGLTQQEATKVTSARVCIEQVDLADFSATESFDTVVSFSHLHWLQTPLQTLSCAYQALKSGGKLYLQCFARHGHLQNDRFFYAESQALQWRGYFERFRPIYQVMPLTLVVQLLGQAGFILQRAEFKCYPSYFDHKVQLATWMETWVSHLHRLPSRAQKTFLMNGLDRYMCAHNLADEAAIHYHEYCLEIVAEKNTLPQSAARQLLTPREASVLQHYLQGCSAKEIGQLLAVSHKTIEFHVANIKAKLDCQRRSQIYQAAMLRGYI